MRRAERVSGSRGAELSEEKRRPITPIEFARKQNKLPVGNHPDDADLLKGGGQTEKEREEMGKNAVLSAEL